MKNLKRALALIIGTVMLIGIMPSISVGAVDSVSYFGTCGDNLTWTIDKSTGVLTISGTGAMDDFCEYGSSSEWSMQTPAPWYNSPSFVETITAVVIGSGVTYIGDYAFHFCSGVTSVSIPSSVTSMGDYAFSYCSALSSITIPNSVTTIGERAFDRCTALTSITIPNSVTSIGDYAFCGCSSLKSVTIGSGLKSLNYALFLSCTALTDVSIGSGVTSINTYAFNNCRNLTSITIPSGVTNIVASAFGSCGSLNISVASGNQYYSSVDGVLFNKDQTAIVAYTKNNISNGYTIPDGVTRIAPYAFASCSNMVSITIPTSVTKVNSWAFYGCSALTDVYYGGSKSNWSNITFENQNTCLTNATIHYSCNTALAIESATLVFESVEYDILSQSVSIDSESTTAAYVKVTLSGIGSGTAKVYLSQGVGKEIELTDGAAAFIPAQTFSANKTIYVLAISTDTASSVSKATKLKVSSGSNGSTGASSGVTGLNFKLGGDIGFTIPDDVPVVGGTEIAWSIDLIPVSVEYDRDDDNKINIVFGTKIATEKHSKNGVEYEYFTDFDFSEYKKNLKSATSKQNRTLKQLRNDFKMSDNQKVSFFGGDTLAGGSSKLGGDIDIAGFAELKYINGEWKFAEGQFAVEASVNLSYNGQIFIWVVPAYYTITGVGGVTLEGDIVNISSETFTPEFDAYLTAKAGVEIGAGLGITKVASLGASGEATYNQKFALTKTYLKSWVEGDAKFNVKLFGKTVASKTLAKGEYLIFETGNSKGLISGSDVSLKGLWLEVEPDGVYPSESRAYAAEPTVWFGEASTFETMDIDYTNENLWLLAENVYTETAPLLCDIDGTTVCVMRWDNEERSDNDRSMLVYSVYDGSTWSAPKAVDDDGTADFYPSFNDGYLVWQNEKASITDEMTLGEIAQNGEICAAKWNGDGFDVFTITDNDTLDTIPAICANGDGASAVWVANSENDILGTSGTNSIMRSDFDGEEWSEPYEAASGLCAVTNLAAGMLNDEFTTAFVQDNDNDLTTIDERNIDLISGEEVINLTDDDVLNSNPVFAGGILYYYTDGNIAYFNGEETNYVFEEAPYGLTDTFSVDENSDGDAAIWWEKTLDGSASVYCTMRRDGEWSDEIQLTSLDEKARYTSGLLNDNGDFLVVFNSALLEENEIVRSNLYALSLTPSYDLSLTDAYFDENTMTAYATVENSGELMIESFSVSLTDSETLLISDPIKAGESVEIAIPYNILEDFEPQTIVLSVAAENCEEYNTENNSVEFYIGHADISVESVSLSEDETSISANVSNLGYSDAENITVYLREGGTDGAVLAEAAIDLQAYETQSVSFEIDKSSMRFYTAEKQLYITVSYDDEEISLGNNDGYTYLLSDTALADFEAEILSVISADDGYIITSSVVNNTSETTDCEIYTAVYNADGEMTACAVKEVTITSGDTISCDISVECDNISGCVIKTFIWQSESPLCPAAQYTVE